MHLPVLTRAEMSGPSEPELREKCGVFGAWGAAEPARMTHSGLVALQHRGQESAGIVTTNGRVHQRHAQMGLVINAIDAGDIERLDAHAESRHGKPGGAIGHNRYSTTGASHADNMQPFLGHFHGGPVAIGHNGNLVNAAQLRTMLEAAGHAFYTSSDTEVILQLLAHRSRRGESDDPLAGALGELRGAFSLVLLLNDRVEAARDPWGWRPLVLGELGCGAPVVASETVALDVVGARFIREIEPGEIVTLTDDGVSSRRFAQPSQRLAHCIFEQVYFASPASRLFGQTVQMVRERLGERLAQEAPVGADLVIPMPDSGRSAATGFARASVIPYSEAIIPNRYVGRTFIKPTREERTAAVRLKLNIIADLVKGKRCIVVDDSVVRGTTTRAKMDQLRRAGAKEIHLRISSPPIRHPCFFGIDFAEPSQLIATGRSLEEIRDILGVDSLHYLSLEGLLAAVGAEGLPSDDYCTACFSGDYPIDVPDGVGKESLTRC